MLETQVRRLTLQLPYPIMARSSLYSTFSLPLSKAVSPFAAI